MHFLTFTILVYACFRCFPEGEPKRFHLERARDATKSCKASPKELELFWKLMGATEEATQRVHSWIKTSSRDGKVMKCLQIKASIEMGTAQKKEFAGFIQRERERAMSKAR